MKIPNFEQKRHEKYKKYNSSGSSLFNRTQYEEGGFNQNVEAGDHKEKEMQEDQRPMGKDMSKNKVAVSSALSATGNGEALARLKGWRWECNKGVKVDQDREFQRRKP
ncbi:hypothetical protein Tco_1410632 [Tanacetum coccineum]